MTGRCSKCKEPCEVEFVPRIDQRQSPYLVWLSNCCGAPLVEDGERSHDN